MPRGSPELRYHVAKHVYFAVVVDITCESTLGKLWHVQCDAVDGLNLVVIGKSIAAYRRVHRRQKRALEASLHHTSRQLAAACLRSAGNDDSEKIAGMEAFETAFTQVRPGFTEELLRRHPGLTAYELRLCSLLSIGLDTKEIARILSIQPDSVKKSRQRLRSKLSIPSGMTFVQYFTSQTSS